MKGFLFDQNLPARLIFKPALPVFAPTALGPNPTDSELREHAQRVRLAIVSKDADFSERVIVNSPPP